MNEKDLETLRAKYLIKFWLLIIIPTFLVIALLYVFILYNNIFPESLMKMIFTAVFIVVVYLYISSSSVSKDYENTVKQHLLKIAFKRIPDLDINWETYGYSTEDNTPKEQQKWNEKFDDERRKIIYRELNIERSKMYSELENIVKDKKQEDLTDEDLKKLELFDLKAEKFLKKEKKFDKEQYKKDCTELEQLNLNLSKSKKNYYKAQYLKEKIKEFEKQVKIDKFSNELKDLTKKNEDGTITAAEKERIEHLEKILKEHNSKEAENLQKEHALYQRLTLIQQALNSSMFEDDKFFGTYKGKNFIFVEAHDESSKSHSAVFNGTILKVELNNQFDNRVLVLKKMIFSAETWYKTVKKKLKKLSIKLPFHTNYEIYTKNISNVNSIVNNDFINFVNTIKKDYSYIIENNNLYVIIPHKNDKYKFGNLFKKINDKSQYKSFYQDINEILKIIEYVKKFAF